MIELLRETNIPTWVCLAASVAAGFFFVRMNFIERLVTSVLWINLAADLSGTILVILKKPNVALYNINILVLALLVLYVYGESSPISWLKKACRIAQVGVMLLWGFFYFRFGITDTFHYLAYAITALILSAFSYLLMRNMVLRSSVLPPIVLFFALANFTYYSLGLASQYAEALNEYLTNTQSLQLKVYVHNVGYILSSLMILTGIIWNHRRITTYSL